MKVKIPKMDCNECRKQMFMDCQYDVYTNIVEGVACGALCMGIWALEQMGKDEDEIKEFVRNYYFIADTPTAFGKEISSPMAMKSYTKKYGINFNKLKVHKETKEHFMKRFDEFVK